MLPADEAPDATINVWVIPVKLSVRVPTPILKAKGPLEVLSVRGLKLAGVETAVSPASAQAPGSPIQPLAASKAGRVFVVVSVEILPVLTK
jgi:hypothetical protein